MGELQLYGMKAAYDEIMATAVKRQHEPQRIFGDLLTAEINEKQARSIKYQLSIAKLPLAKDLDDFQFDGTPINETLVRDLADHDRASPSSTIRLKANSANIAPHPRKDGNGAAR
jgi:IstB-like ATP binding protein